MKNGAISLLKNGDWLAVSARQNDYSLESGCGAPGPFFQQAAAPHFSTARPALVRVLVADPDERLLAAHREQLHEGFELATATNGIECLARLRAQAFDVLVLEPQLPWEGDDGALAVLRHVSRLAPVPVMILTACRDVRVLKAVAAFRINDYCVKPLGPGQLAARIRRVLECQKLRGPPVKPSR